MKKALIALAALAAVPASANAASLAVDGGWSSFYFGGTGSTIYDSVTNDSTYDFTLSGAAELKVTDAYVIGDAFTLYNFGSLLFTTGAFDTSGPTTSDADTAFAGSSYSHGSVILGPGSYSISGIASTSCCGSGGAFISLATPGAVPEPASWAMMIGGFGMVGGALRRTRTTARVSLA